MLRESNWLCPRRSGSLPCLGLGDTFFLVAADLDPSVPYHHPQPLPFVVSVLHTARANWTKLYSSGDPDHDLLAPHLGLARPLPFGNPAVPVFHRHYPRGEVVVPKPPTLISVEERRVTGPPVLVPVEG